MQCGHDELHSVQANFKVPIFDFGNNVGIGDKIENTHDFDITFYHSSISPKNTGSKLFYMFYNF